VGVGVGPTFTQMNAAGGLYQDAEAVWNFNLAGELGRDYSGNGHTLTDVGGNVEVVGGANGYAVEFDLPTNNYADDDGDDFNFGATETDFAVAGWFYPTGCAAAHCGIVGYAQPASNGISWHVYDQAGVLAFQTSTNGQISGRTILTCKTGLADDQWIYFEASYDFTTDTMKCQANQEGEVSVGAGHPFDTSIPEFAVGGYSLDGTMTGRIDTVAIWTGTTTIPTDMWNGGTGNDCSRVTRTNGFACYDFDEASGGPYSDKWGAHNLVGVNTPTRNLGLAGTAASGLGIDTNTGGIMETATGLWGAFDGVDVMITGWFVPGDSGSNRKSVGTCKNYLDPGYVGLFTGATESASVTATDSLGGYVSTAQHDLSATKYEWHFFAYGFEHSIKKPFLRIDGGAVSYPGAALPNALAVDDSACDPAHQSFSLYGAGNSDLNHFDMVAVWNTSYDATLADALYDSGSGYFFAAVWDTIFNGPRFAWSQKPTLRRF
jgi:hypothetical protein